MKKIVIGLFATFISLAAFAQGSTNSPYSQYGLGAVADAATGFNRGMNGLGIGYRSGSVVNYLNPASYSAVDSLTFLFDVGMSGQITNFEQAGKRLNANSAGVEYVAASFRAFRGVGVSFGLMPLTTIGYNYSNSETISPALDANVTTYTNTYSGSGGLHQAFLGAGWEPFSGFSFGANFSYVWGNVTRSTVNSYSLNASDASSINTLSKYYTGSVSSYKADFGVQYQLALGKRDNITVGLTYGLGHKLGTDPTCWIISKNAESGVADTTKYVVSNGFELPSTIGAGAIYSHAGKWKVGIDYQLQKWGATSFPVYSTVSNQATYALSDNYYKDRQKLTLGGEYCPNENGRRFYQIVRLRAGISYATPYLTINGEDGPKELSVSAGISLPILNSYRRNYLNISGQWVRQEAKGMIKENTFRLNIGLTFNERWFAKWKVE